MRCSGRQPIDGAGSKLMSRPPRYVSSFGSEGSGAGRFDYACLSVAWNPSGFVWVGDGQSVQIFSSKGEFVAVAAAGRLHRWCSGIACDTNGEVFLADCEHGRVVVCLANGAYVRHFALPPPPPTPPNYDAELFKANNYMFQLAVDGKGLVFVSESAHHRVLVVRRDGKSVREIGKKGTDDGELLFPQGIVYHGPTDTVIVADGHNNRVQIFDAHGKFVRKLGCTGSESARCVSPRAVAVDAAGHIWVADSGNHRVQVFRMDGTLLGVFGYKGLGLRDPAHFFIPRCLCLDADGRRVFVGDHNKRVQIFAVE